MIYRFAGCELDTTRYELQVEGVARPLEPQIFDLLCYLVENGERTVTKRELYDSIWPGKTVSESTLSSRVRDARQAVGDNGRDQRVIKTIHGRGYRLIAAVETQDQGGAREGTSDSAGRPPGRAASTKPSLAVLPFVNLDASGDEAYFADGITDEITLALARHRWLRVVSRHSSFLFKDSTADAREIARTLGVRYLLEGSVRRAGPRVRIGVQLVQGSDGTQLWSERYERRLEDVFQLQDEIAQSIAGTLEPELAQAEAALSRGKASANLSAWDCYQRGRWHLFTFTDRGFDQAEQLFARAVAIDPGLAQAHAGQASVHIQRAFYDDPAGRGPTIEAALSAARRAVAADDRDAFGHYVLGRANSLRRSHDEAIAELETAIELNPSYAQAHYARGFSLVSSRRPAAAIPCFRRFTSLSPRDPLIWTNFAMWALAHFWMAELDLAEAYILRSLRQHNVTWRSRAHLTAILGATDRQGEAERAAAALFEERPGYSCETARDDLFFLDDPAGLEAYLTGLRRAGIP